LLLCFAFVLFVVAGMKPETEPWRGRFVCYGLACAIAAEIIRLIPSLRI
jgi:hypothetical protein